MTATDRTLSYDLYGTILTITAWPELAAALDARLARFRLSRAPAAADIAFIYSRRAPAESIARPSPARAIYDPPEGEVLYDAAGDCIYLSCGSRIRGLCELRGGRVQVVAERPQPADIWLLSHPMFTLPFVELFKRRGFFPVHAAAAALDGAGLLLAGTSGAGKSTLAVALLDAGLDFHGDDTVFLRPTGAGGVELVAFPDEVDLTHESLAMMPGLAARKGIGKPEGWRKFGLRGEEAFARPVAWRCAPRLLVFPRVQGLRQDSAMEPIGADEALLELAPNVLLTQPAASQAHFDALAQLARACTCYRLETGRDLAAAAALLRAQLER